MVQDLFESLLSEVGKAVGIAELKPDANNSCLIDFPDGPSFQMEILKNGEGFIIASRLGHLPPGRYRDNILKEALKVNGQFLNRKGILALSKKSDQLILFTILPLKNISSQMILQQFAELKEPARLWKEALASGSLPNLPGYEMARPSGMFGLRS